MKIKRFASIFLAIAFFAFAALTPLLLPAQSAEAQGYQERTPHPTRTPHEARTPNPTHAPDETLLAKLSEYFQREQTWFGNQSQHLQAAYEAAAKTQALIDAARAEGKDVASLESGLAAFNAAVAQAQVDHDAAASLIASHNGFDENNTVTDAETARLTVQGVRASLNSAHMQLIQASLQLKQTIEAWAAANP